VDKNDKWSSDYVLQRLHDTRQELPGLFLQASCKINQSEPR
jgi:hypothetical protein